MKTAIDSLRIHHQLAPMEVEYEVGMDKVKPKLASIFKLSRLIF